MNLKNLITTLFAVLLLYSTNVFAEQYRVNTERLNVRSTVGAASKPFGYIKFGDTVDVISTANSYWYKVKIQGQRGYVRSKYLTLINNSTFNNNQNQIRLKNDIIVVAVFLIFVILCIVGIISINKKRAKKELDYNNSGTIIITKNKSVGLAILLTFLFGPFGMFYATIRGALIMLLLPVLTLVGLLLLSYSEADNILLGIALISTILFFGAFYWLICIIWAAVAASKENRTIITQPQPNYNEI